MDVCSDSAHQATIDAEALQVELASNGRVSLLVFSLLNLPSPLVEL